MAAKTAHGQSSTGAADTQSASLHPNGHSEWPLVYELTGHRSRETVRLWEKAGLFPRRVRVTQRTTLWPNRELLRWAADPEAYRAVPAEQQAA